MEVWIRRHAPTGGNLLSQYIGSTDQSLSPEGEAVARRATALPEVERVHTSRLLRTRMTAGILYPNAEVVPCAGLDEMNFGSFEGRCWRDLEDDDAYRKWLDFGCESRCPGGEDKEGFSRRCREAFSAILADEFARGAAALHLVVHGGTIMSVLGGLAEPEREYFSWRAGFCGGYLLACDDPSAARPLRLLESILPPPDADSHS